jgi:hypothetical protein
MMNRRQLGQTTNLGLLMVALVVSGVVPAAANAAVCGINFDDHAALQGIYFLGSDTTHAYKTSKSPFGFCADRVTYPDSRMLHPGCRMYEQACGTGTKIFAWDQSSDQHYHLYFQDPAYSGDNTGCFVGYHKVNGACVKPADYAALYRFLHAMQGGNWLEIGRTDDGTTSLYPFGMSSVDVKSGPIQLWFKRTDGSVAGWNSLPQGNWLLNTGNVVAVWIASAPGNPASYELWDFAVTAP